MIATMPQSGKNKGNKNAVLKPGELHRIQWTESLSGPELVKFAQYFNLDTSDEKQLRLDVAKKAREWLHDMVKQLPD